MSAFLPVLTLPRVSRALGTDSLGEHQIATSFAMYFIAFGAFGIPLFGQRETSAVRHQPSNFKYRVTNLYFFSIAISSVTYSAFIVLSLLINPGDVNKLLLAIVGLPILVNALSGEWALLAVDDFVFISLRQFFFLLCSVLGIILFIDKPGDLNLYAALLILPQVAAVFLNLPKIWPHLEISSISRKRITDDARGASVFLASAIASTMYTSLDSIALSIFRTTGEVGEYALAKRIILAAISGATALSAITVSRSSNYNSQQSITGFNRLVLYSIRFLLLVALPSVVAIILLRKEIVLFFGGTEYNQSMTTLAILAPNILIVGIGFVALVQILIPRGQEKKALICWAIGGGVGLLSVVFLVPSFGTIGAAIANLTAESVVMGVAVWFARKDLISNIHLDEIILATCSLIMMIIVISYVRQNISPSGLGTQFFELAILASIAAITYFGTVMIGIKAINRNCIK